VETTTRSVITLLRSAPGEGCGPPCQRFNRQMMCDRKAPCAEHSPMCVGHQHAPSPLSFPPSGYRQNRTGLPISSWPWSLPLPRHITRKGMCMEAVTRLFPWQWLDASRRVQTWASGIGIYLGATGIILSLGRKRWISLACSLARRDRVFFLFKLASDGAS
jgi:hypothetical protein